MKIWDAFISHASEDKANFVRPLAEELSKHSLKIWYDEFTLTVGDSLRRSIDEGIAQSRYGIVVLSPNYFAKGWSQRELDGLFAREVNGEKVVLPVWHKVTKADVLEHSPILADLYAAQSSKGINHVVNELLRAIRPGTTPGSLGSEYLLGEALFIHPINGMSQNIYFWDSFTWEKRRRGEPLYEHEDPDFFVRIHLLLKALADIDITNFDFHYLPFRFAERAFSRHLIIDNQPREFDASNRLIEKIALKKGEVIDVKFTKKYVVFLNDTLPYDYGELIMDFEFNIRTASKLNSHSLQCKLEPGGELKFLETMAHQ